MLEKTPYFEVCFLTLDTLIKWLRLSLYVPLVYYTKKKVSLRHVPFFFLVRGQQGGGSYPG
jgi:hypothetical protein